MIAKLEISAVHANVDKKLHDYVAKKIGKLDQYMSKHARISAHAEVKLIEHKIKAKKECTCEVILHLPQDTIMTKETTLNMYAAVDIVEAKLKNRLRKYKETHGSLRLHRRILARLRNKSA